MELETKKITNDKWRVRKLVELPKDVNDYLFDVLEKHRKEITEKYGDKLTNNETMQQLFHAFGELVCSEKKGVVYLQIGIITETITSA